VGELAVAAVGLTPLVEQGQDLGLLLGQQPMRRGPAGSLIRQLPARAATDPAVRPYLAELKFVTGPPDRPAAVERLVEQIEQSGLGGRVDPARDPATQPQPPFPSTSISFTAISFSASDNRATSALASSNS
jgi:hypothetical protein